MPEIMRTSVKILFRYPEKVIGLGFLIAIGNYVLGFAAMIPFMRFIISMISLFLNGLFITVIADVMSDWARGRPLAMIKSVKAVREHLGIIMGVFLRVWAICFGMAMTLV